MESMQGKTALVTGASSGIGKELSTIHAERGGNLVIVARSKESLESLKENLEKKYSVSVHVMVKDLSLPESAKEIYEEVKQKGLLIDFLINNAGFGGWGKFFERKWELDQAMINVNVLALTALTRFFLSDFVKRGSGRILNVSSGTALMPGPLQAVYFATKAYVTSFSNALAEEVSDTNITVTTLIPGVVETQFAKTSGMDKTDVYKKTVSARTVAEDGYNGMMGGKLNVISGVTFGQRLMFATIPFIPKRILLRAIHKRLEVK